MKLTDRNSLTYIGPQAHLIQPRNGRLAPNVCIWRFQRPQGAFGGVLTSRHSPQPQMVSGKVTVRFDEQLARATQIESRFNDLIEDWSRPRGDEAQEDFVFSRVYDFITQYRFCGLSLLDIAVTTRDLPSSARYYYAYLLGHIDDRVTFRARLEYLRKYEQQSEDHALAEGAAQAFDHIASL